MAGERASKQEGAPAGRQGKLLDEALEKLQKMLMTLQQDDFSERIGKISVYVQSAARSRDAKTIGNFIRFAHLNLDSVLAMALEALVFRPRLASKTDEHKKAAALQKTFDRLDSPAKAMLEHYRSSSDPLNKYLVAGTWGHEYLHKRKIDTEAFNMELCEILRCGETPAGRIVLNYERLCLAINEIEEQAKQSSA